MRVCAARRGAASPASALPPPRPPRRQPSGKGPAAERAGRGGRGRPTGRQPSPSGSSRGSRWRRAPTCRPARPTATPGIGIAQCVSVIPVRHGGAAALHAKGSAGAARRQTIILPLLPKAEEMRDLPGGEQPPLTEEVGVSAPSRDVGAFHVLLHRGRPWPLIFGQRGREKQGHFHCERLPAGFPRRVCPPISTGHLREGQEKR